MVSVDFHYLTGLAAPLFEAAELHGGWDCAGLPSQQWTVKTMEPFTADDGCPGFRATVAFPAGAAHSYDWGVRLRRGGVWYWGITEELNDPNLSECLCCFVLDPDTGGPRQVSVRLNWSRHLGAQKVHRPGEADARIRFAVWAPHARAVGVVMADAWNGDTDERALDPAAIPAFRPVPAGSVCGGYIADDGSGAHPTWGPFPLQRHADGVWRSDPEDPALASFARFHHALYMFQITRDDGSIRYSTDLYSRCQAGFGTTRPQGAWRGRTLDLDGSVSASVVKDPDVVCREFSEPVYPEQHWLPSADFWPDPASLPPRPRRVQELVIDELHVGALGGGRREPHEPGTLEDAIAYLDHLVELGVNAVELLPMAESGGGGAGWGYATSHYFAIEYAGGGRDKYKHFIRECHRRGIAVILDVVFNHYHHDAPRAQWQVDSTAPEHNIYYWYEGLPGDYPLFDALVPPERRGHGGYIDNQSSGWAPRYWEPMVRRLFISSLLTLVTEFHIDGFRFDQTTSIHAYNRRHADGEPVAAANRFGQKLLREACRALRLVQPDVMLMAEDHSNWPAVTQPLEQGGLGFDASWYADFYHHLIGDTNAGQTYARLLQTAGLGDDRPLAIRAFASALAASSQCRVVYHESHDEAGNGHGTARTLRVAVNNAPLVGSTRRSAEARVRVVAGLTLLSAGVPMFLFGEEVGATAPFLYGRVLELREDLTALRDGQGASLFAYYKELIRLRLDPARPSLRSRQIEIVHSSDSTRVIAFRRWQGAENHLVIASFSNQPKVPCRILSSRLGEESWREIFNSDADRFGGTNLGHLGGVINASGGALECLLPANSLLVFERL